MNIFKTKLTGRDIHEQHRVSTPLELLFDLTFVVAVAISSAELHHAVIAGHGWMAAPAYLSAFLASWWAWMNYTWFASAYGSDDVTFRLLTMLQMVGVLIFATGIQDLFNTTTTYLGVTGYAVMRIALVIQWLRAAQGDPQRQKTCLRYGLGILVVQMLWVARLWFAPPFL